MRTNGEWQEERDAGTSTRVAETVAGALESLRVEAGITVAAPSALGADPGGAAPTL